MSANFCSNCGIKSNGGNYCSSCGASLHGGTHPVPENPNIVPMMPYMPNTIPLVGTQRCGLCGGILGSMHSCITC